MNNGVKIRIRYWDYELVVYVIINKCISSLEFVIEVCFIVIFYLNVE